MLLEPFGANEKRDAELWERLGSGISFDKWRESGFDVPMVENPHIALAEARARLVDCSQLPAS